MGYKMVPMTGLEPARLASLPPQDSVSTNFTTSADLFIDVDHDPFFLYGMILYEVYFYATFLAHVL